jgi:hypothetical protein
MIHVQIFWVEDLAASTCLKMEAARFSKTMVSYGITTQKTMT